MVNKSIVLILIATLYISSSCKAQHQKVTPYENKTTTIDTLLTPEIGGIKQVIGIKTDDAKKPILLFLSGGPGSSMIRGAERFTKELNTKFTIVHWDQRDAGKTLALNPSPTQPSVSQMKQDTYQVVQFITKKLKQDKIHLLGSSWGNVLGFYMVQHHPELLHAYYASNPVISQLASEKELLDILKAHFKDNAIANEELAKVKIPFEIDEDLFYIRKWLFYKNGKAFATSAGFKKGFLQWSKTWAPAWNEVMAIDLPKTLKIVQCPIYFFVGKSDIQTSTAITTSYFEELKAPKKALFLFKNSGHQIHQDEPKKFQDIIIQILNAKN